MTTDRTSLEAVDETKVETELLSAEVKRVVDRQGKRQRVQFMAGADHKRSIFGRKKGG